MIPFPNVSPEIISFSIGSFEFALRWYAVSYIFGFICALYLMKALLKREKLWRNETPPMEPDQADSMLTYLILGVLIGGRLGYVLFYNAGFYMTNPINIIRVWDGGMSFHGGFLGVVFAVIFFCIANKISLWSAADLIAVASPPGLLFGRIANFINSELWGRPTEVPWGVIFEGEKAQDCLGVLGVCARHPSQLYEGALEGILLFAILIFLALRGALRKPGILTGIFLSGYGLARFLVEFYRVPDPQFLSNENPHGWVFAIGNLGVTMGQFLTIPMVLAGVALILIFYSDKNNKVN